MILKETLFERDKKKIDFYKKMGSNIDLPIHHKPQMQMNIV